MLLLDTQIVLWLTRGVTGLSANARSAMCNEVASGGQLAIAAVTLMEVAMLHGKGKIVLQYPLEDYLVRIEKHYAVPPLTAKVALQASRFGAKFPKDPADRQIAATAVIHAVRLVTADKLILKSGEVTCIW